MSREEYANGIQQNRKKEWSQAQLLGMPKPAYFCVHFKYLIFLTHTWDRRNTHSPIKCNELHVRLVHLTTSVGLAAMLQGFLYWQRTTTAALPLCYPTCQAQPGCLTQDPLTSCTGCREPCSPVQQLGSLYLLYALIFNRTRMRGTLPGTSFLSPISMHAFGL